MRNEYRSSRYGRRTKNRKANVILNSLIGIVLLSIILVSANIFLGDNKAAEEEEQRTEEQEEKVDEETSAPVEEEEETASENEDTTANDNNGNSEEKEDVVIKDETNVEDDAEAVVTEGGTDPEVIRTIVNPAWQPVGTVQVGDHSNSYDRDGSDWNEMVNAITYATGLSQDNMTIYFLGNNGQNKSVGTVYSKNKAEIYRVYIEWVNGEGWKPSMVEELSAVPENKKKEENEENES